MMGGLLLLGLLGSVGLTAFVIDEIGSDDDDNDGITGTPGDDAIDGTARADTITARGGADIVSAGGGNDLVRGGDGADFILGGNGADTLLGEGGDDELIGGRGDDLLQGGAGDDVLVGIDIGLNTQSAAVLRDLIRSERIDEFSASGEDQHGSDTLIGGDGEDVLLLGGGDVGTGGAGEDRFQIGDWIGDGTVATITDYEPAADFIDYSYVARGAAPQVTVAPDDDGNALLSVDGVVVARVLGAATTLTPAQVILSERAGNSDPESGLNRIFGTAGDDLMNGRNVGDEISGADGNDVIAAAGGRDVVYGQDGNDVIFGGNGADTLWGGVGDDVIIGGSGGDLLQGNAGDDLVLGIDIALGSGSAAAIAALDLSPTTAGSLLDEFARTPSLDLSGADTLLGGRGDDVIVMGGNDTATGGFGADRFWLGEWVGGTDTATITDFDRAEDQIVYIYSAATAATPTPVITVTSTASGNATVLADGVAVAVVEGAGATLTAADITLIARAPAAAA